MTIETWIESHPEAVQLGEILTVRSGHFAPMGHRVRSAIFADGTVLLEQSGQTVVLKGEIAS